MKKRKWYIKVSLKFALSHLFAWIWLIVSIYFSLKWIEELSSLVGLFVSLIIITGISYIPGYMMGFMVISLLMDRQPEFKKNIEAEPVTIMIAAYNEESRIGDTLKFIKKQDYEGILSVVLVDNNSTDNTSRTAREVADSLQLNLTIVNEKKSGKSNALNTGLASVKTNLMITLDADTLLHVSAVRMIVSRLLSSPKEVCSVAGAVLVRNSRENLLTKIQEWDYFLSIASVKRLQGMYQQTLVAQGAFSIYKTENVKQLGGWNDSIGEDIVLTWKFLKSGWKVYFEPKAIAFTTVPTSFSHLVKQRSRWARGMIEGLREVKPWRQPSVYAKYLTGVNFVMPYIDVSYSFFWIPGLVLAIFGYFWIVGPLTLFVLPLTCICYATLYLYQKRVFAEMNLRVRKNNLGFIIFVLFYQLVMSPVSVVGYIQEILGTKRIWK